MWDIWDPQRPKFDIIVFFLVDKISNTDHVALIRNYIHQLRMVMMHFYHGWSEKLRRRSHQCFLLGSLPLAGISTHFFDFSPCVHMGFRQFNPTSLFCWFRFLFASEIIRAGDCILKVPFNVV